MNKTELVASIAGRTNLTKAQVGEVFDGLIETIKEGVGKGEKIAIPGFLTFEVVDRPQTTARNPSTGAEIIVPARKAVKVRVGKSLKDAA